MKLSLSIADEGVIVAPGVILSEYPLSRCFHALIVSHSQCKLSHKVVTLQICEECVLHELLLVVIRWDQ